MKLQLSASNVPQIMQIIQAMAANNKSSDQWCNEASNYPLNPKALFYYSIINPKGKRCH